MKPPEAGVSDPDAALRETTVEQGIAFQGRFLTVRDDLARMPDGELARREFVVHPGASAMLVLDADGRVLVERQFRYPMQAVYLEIPAGKRDPGESFFDTARRELLEETGFVGRQWARLTAIDTAIGFTDERIEIWLVRDLEQQDRKLDQGEFIELHWATLPELTALLRRGELPDVKTQIAVLWLERMVRGDWPWPAFETVKPC